MNSDLRAEQFAEFFAEIYPSSAPFTWQRELVTRAVEAGTWPSEINIPTGLGKTAVIDAFVFLSALDPKRFGRRLFFVIDRRVVVDQVRLHAQHLAGRLHAASSGVAAVVAARLRPPDGGRSDRPLWIERMRGGATWPWQWVDRPSRTAVIVGTAAQIGSRLLFRGYGVPPNRYSIDAALVGTNSVIVVDEAHIAGPMVQSCTDALRFDRAPLVPHAQVVTMSATPANQTAEGWRVECDPDRETNEAKRRLFAYKRLTTRTVTPPTKPKAEATNAAALVDCALELVNDDRRIIGIFCNTVRRARVVFDELSARVDGGRVALLTGRMRSFDRDRWIERWLGTFDATTRDRANAEPAFLVATQAVEVGVDVDLDAVVTESASLDAIVQRIGRCNRRGLAASSEVVVVHDTTTPDDDPVYGASRNATFAWLAATAASDPGGFDASPLALTQRLANLTPQERATLQREDVDVPVVTRRRIDCWVRTSPTPEPDTPVEPFIYGFRDAVPTVTVLWRAGLMAGDEQRALDEIEQCPPRPFETIELPLWSLQEWLRGGTRADAFADIDAGDASTEAPPDERLVYVVRPNQPPARLPASEVRPNDTVVVPVEYGGIDEFGWNPRSQHAFDSGDLGEHRGRRILRVGPSLRHHLAQVAERGDELAASLDALAAALRGEEDDDQAKLGLLDAWLRDTAERVPDDDAYRLLREALQQACSNDRRRPRFIDTALAATNEQVLHTFAVVTVSRADTTNTNYAEDDTAQGSSIIGQPIPLDVHQVDVAERAEAMANAIGLPARVVRTIRAAAGVHDEGKRDPRFQAMLHNGNRIAAEAALTPLAKSGMDPSDRRAFRAAWLASKYPSGMRHEALSAQIAKRMAATDDEIDPELLLHLVASHHGRSRPLLPAVVDNDPQVIEIEGLGTFDTSETVDWDAPARFAALNERYGIWGLALCEAIVRLADQNASARPRLDDAQVDVS